MLTHIVKVGALQSSLARGDGLHSTTLEMFHRKWLPPSHKIDSAISSVYVQTYSAHQTETINRRTQIACPRYLPRILAWTECGVLGTEVGPRWRWWPHSDNPVIWKLNDFRLLGTRDDVAIIQLEGDRAALISETHGRWQLFISMRLKWAKLNMGRGFAIAR